MKRLGRVVGAVLAVMLAVFSLQALAEAPLAGRDFNHNATGFPLTGVHTLTACETCHVAGVFKGTPRNCDGCHALGKRVIATPKTTDHIVTDAPCESCHFNASTFLGARFNHGTALPGQCRTCHNGRQSMGKPASHSSGNKLTASCDQCHRSYTWFSASWNHVGVVPGTCNSSGCHFPGSGNLYTVATATSPMSHTYTEIGSKSCDVCHTSFVVWTSVMHEPQTDTCANCHNGARAETHVTSSHPSTIGTTDCTQCHTSTVTWLGALGGTPALHVLYTAGVQCTSCHIGATTVLTGASLHAYFAGQTCASCHLTKGLVYTQYNSIQTKNHNQPKDCASSGCHTSTGYVSWNH